MVIQPLKKVHAARDLAINGGPPAFAEPLHVGRPNVGSRAEFERLTGEMFERGWFTNDGPLVQEFEQRIADRLGARHCIAMCNGTVALEIAIRALGLEGEVIVPSYTFVATAHALTWQGIKPVFADIDAKTHNLDPDSVRAVITDRTTGIIGVHLWGRAAPVGELQQIADEFGLSLMFDAAHAFDCTSGGQIIGSFGRAEVFSFHSTKFFNSFEGGAVLTDEDDLAGAMRLMRNFGFAGYDKVIHPGTNGKMTEVCAAMGLANLAGLGGVVAANRRNHDHYSRVLAPLGLDVLPFDDAEQNNYQYVVAMCPDETRRDDLVDTLHAENVLARRYFWPGCHRLHPYREMASSRPGSLAETEQVASRVLVLPTGPSVSATAIDTIAAVVEQRLEGLRLPWSPGTSSR